MEISTTRISDLPENIPSFMEPIKVSRPKDEQMITAPTYQPMNDIHPNPYGIEKPKTIPDFSSGMMRNNNNQPDYDFMHQQMPSKDYPRETIGYSQDVQTQPNYIPPVKNRGDFVAQHDAINWENWENHRQKKHRVSKMDQIINEFQTPFFLALLFFMFQLTAFNSFIFKNFAFLSIYNMEGTPNQYGYVFKSVLFSLCYYSSIKLMDYFSEV
jgi:hypothetical protein